MRLGTRVGSYVLQEYVGSGGFARTYLAQNDQGDPVALKILDTDSRAMGDAARGRFQRELQLGQRLSSKYVARILDFDMAHEPPWIAFSYISGRDLDDLIEDDAPLAYERVTGLARQLAEALDDLHAHHLVHRDIKPANIRIGANDSLTVVDLGIAWHPDIPALTEPGGAVGTIAYMPPESHSGTATPAPAWDM